MIHNMQNENKYDNIHKWLYRHYGKASKCENIKCQKKSFKFHWALRNGMKYDRNVENFIMLCPSCHYYYDNRGELLKKRHYKKVSASKEKNVVKFNSIKEASLLLKISQPAISNNLIGLSKNAGGYIFNYNV